MTDILDDLKAPSYFCISLRKRAADKIKQLRDELDDSRDDVVGLSEALKERDKMIAARDKMIDNLRDHLSLMSKQSNRLQQRLRDISEALDAD